MALVAGIILCAVFAFAFAPELPPVQSPQVRTSVVSSTVIQNHTQPIGHYAIISRRRLRSPLYPPPPETPPEPEVAQVVATQLKIVLQGTVIERDHEYAVFKTSGGESKIVSIGEWVENAELVSLDATSAILKYSGKLVTLEVIKKVRPPAQVLQRNNRRGRR